MAVRLDDARADAIIFFNRFYQPEFDIEQLEITPRLTLSRPEELLLRLHWAAILFGHVRADLAITGGAHGARDVIKCVLAGAKVAFRTSALVRNGVQHAAHVLSQVNRWLDEHEYTSVQRMCGRMSHGAVADAGAFERGNYMKVLNSYTLRGNAFHD
jgi:dihydroorotate dehydrogenase (fumarate)